MSVHDDTRPTSVDSVAAGASNSQSQAAAMSSLLTDDVTTSDDHQPQQPQRSSSKPHAHHTVHIRDPPVSDTTTTAAGGTHQTAVWSEQKHGPLHRAIPSMPMPLAVIACILNIILPGTGTSHLLTYLSVIILLLSLARC